MKTASAWVMLRDDAFYSPRLSGNPMAKRWFDLNIGWPDLAEDSLPLRNPDDVAARVLTALGAAGVVAHELRHGVVEMWGLCELTGDRAGLGVFEWGQFLRVDDIWATVLTARHVLATLGAPPQSTFEVWGRDRRIVRTYLLNPGAADSDEWWDLDRVERLSALPAGWVRQ